MLVAAPCGGRLEKRWVNRGQEVAAGAPLFALEQENEKAARREAEERVRNAEAKLANIAAGKRKPELDAVQAQEAQAAAARELSERQLKQQEALHAKGFLSDAGLDAARANYDRDIARVAEMEAQIRARAHGDRPRQGDRRGAGRRRGGARGAGAKRLAPRAARGVRRRPRRWCTTRSIRRANGWPPAIRW